MKKKLIELRNIVKSFDDEVVVDNINLYIYENEFVTLVGPSGCGKTTILRMICLLYTSQNTERTEVLSIMIYGNEPGFTVIQEFVNDQEAMRYQEEEGDIVMVMGACAILKNNSVILFFNGIEYTCLLYTSRCV